MFEGVDKQRKEAGMFCELCMAEVVFACVCVCVSLRTSIKEPPCGRTWTKAHIGGLYSVNIVGVKIDVVGVL